MNRVMAAARLHTANPQSLGMPWLITMLAFAVNLAIWTVSDASTSGATTGGVATLYAVMLFSAGLSVTQLLPFAMGLSLSRRVFLRGAAVAALLTSLAFGLLLSALVPLEDATGGWGVGLDFWAPGALDVDDPLLQVLVMGTLVLAACSLGLGVGVVLKRWGASGVWVLLLGSTVIVGGLTVLLAWRRWWGDVVALVGEQSVVTLTVGVPLVVALLAAELSAVGLRRVVP